MTEPQVIHNTFTLERTYAKPVETVFAAFSDPGKKRRWFGEAPTHTIDEFSMDFRTGGSDRLAYRFNDNTPFPGVELVNSGTYHDIVPNRRIILAQQMTMAGALISAALATFQFLSTSGGTNLIFTHQAAFLEGSGGPEMRKLGWNELFAKLDQQLAY